MHKNNNIVKFIKNNEELTLEQSFYFAQQCMLFIDSSTEEDKEYGRKIIINILDNWNKLPNATLDIWSNIIESAGFYPYIEQKQLCLNNFSAEIRKGLLASKNIGGKIFHDKQKEIVDI